LGTDIEESLTIYSQSCQWAPIPHYRIEVIYGKDFLRTPRKMRTRHQTKSQTKSHNKNDNKYYKVGSRRNPIMLFRLVSTSLLLGSAASFLTPAIMYHHHQRQQQEPSSSSSSSSSSSTSSSSRLPMGKVVVELDKVTGLQDKDRLGTSDPYVRTKKPTRRTRPAPKERTYISHCEGKIKLYQFWFCL
jgi:hypothetical protein